MLPDNVLVEIFDFYRNNHEYTRHTVWKWHLLVHVCQRWRQIVFVSPHRLNHQILCTHKTPARKNLGIWPAFPIVIDYRYSWRGVTPNNKDNVIAALEHPSRICYVNLNVTGPQLGNMAMVMQEPFPMLTRLDISLTGANASVLPDGFLGGSSPCLQEVYLHGIPFPELPTLLSSTSDLVTLALSIIPAAGYISPEAMVVVLAALPRLETFIIGFQSATLRPSQIHPPPLTRIILPALTTFQFQGACEYLENLVAHIDSPQLDRIYMNYLSINQLVDVQVAQLSKFFDRSVGPKLTLFKHVRVNFFRGFISFAIYRHANHPSSDWLPVSSHVKGLTSMFPMQPTGRCSANFLRHSPMWPISSSRLGSRKTVN